MQLRQLHVQPVMPLLTHRALRARIAAERSGGPVDFAVATADATKPESVRIVPDPELSPRQNLIFQLQVAAEVEHSLLVQYLYAAYSLKPAEPVPGQAGLTTGRWRNLILGIAREEMGHLLTVQNVLRYVGGPLHFDRQHMPYRSKLYPFPFMLRRFTRQSLAKFIFTESPESVPIDLIPQDQQDEIRTMATQDAGGIGVNHVGALYDGILAQFGAFQDSDFPTDTTPWEALADDWTNTAGDLSAGAGVRVFNVSSVKSATDALNAVAVQGEAFVPGQSPGPSAVNAAHFKRFYDIYSVLRTQPAGFEPALPVPDNSNTTDPPAGPIADPEGQLQEMELRGGRITRSDTRCWANLFNVRYRMLLTELAHALSMPAAVLAGKPVPGGTAGAVATPRATLVDWVYDDMKNGDGALRLLAPQLASLDRTDSPGDGKAAAPFELPLTLDLPDLPADRWRQHFDLLGATDTLVGKLLKVTSDPAAIDLLNKIKAQSDARRSIISQNAASGF